MTYEQRLARAEHEDALTNRDKFDRAYGQAERELGFTSSPSLTTDEFYQKEWELNEKAFKILKRKK